MRTTLATLGSIVMDSFLSSLVETRDWRLTGSAESGLTTGEDNLHPAGPEEVLESNKRSIERSNE